MAKVDTPLINGDKCVTKNYQSRISTIFCMVSTILGSTVLSLPWATARAGTVSGIITPLATCFISCLTAIQIVQIASNFFDSRFDVAVQEYLGISGIALVRMASFFVLLIAALLYHCIMADNISSLGLPFLTRKSLPTIVSILLLPVLLSRNSTFIVNMAAFLGFPSSLCLVTFIFFKSIQEPSLNKLEAVGEDPFGLAGILMLSFFLHNLIIPISKKSNPKTLKADVLIAFVITCSIYLLVGITAGMAFGDELLLKDIENILLVFKPTPLTNFVRVAVAIQLFCSYTVVFNVLRTEIKYLYGKSLHIRSVLVVLPIFTFIATMTDKLGVIAGIGGKFSGIIYVFSVPAITYVVFLKKSGASKVKRFFYYHFMIIALLFCLFSITGSSLVQLFVDYRSISMLVVFSFLFIIETYYITVYRKDKDDYKNIV
ncbi:hypothetical protein PCE1_000441 [Barthelona sp. PCE]